MYYNKINRIWNENEEAIEGGLADNKTILDICAKHSCSLKELLQELLTGLEVELEHTDDEKVAYEIALDHLYEDKDYYTNLNQIHEETDFEFMKDTEAFKYLMKAKISPETISQAEELVIDLRTNSEEATNLAQARKWFNMVEKLTDKFNL